MDYRYNNQGNGQYNGGYYYSAPDLKVEDIPHPENRKYGLSRAITAQVLASVSAIIGLVAFYVVILSLIGFSIELEDAGYSFLIFAQPLCAGCVAMSIVALVLGVKSIKCFKQKTPRPIATLVLGISSVVEAVGGLVLAVYDALFMLIAFIGMSF